MYDEISANKRKTWLIMVGFMMLVSGLGYAISYIWLGNVNYTIAILIGAAVYALFSYFSAGKMAVAINGAKQISETDNPRLWRTVENLAITEGMPMPKVYIMEDPALNAFATGRNPENAIVAATTGLLDSMTDVELEGVMAHELGHVKNYDIRVAMIAFALVTAISLISDMFMRNMMWGGHRREGGGGGPAIIIAVVLGMVTPMIASMLRMAVSRKREYLADATGALATRYPEGLASALEKIGKQGSATRRQNTATAHLFFANPLNAGSVSRLFSTHPPITDRVSKLRDMRL